MADTAALLAKLDAYIAGLDEHGYSHWANWMRQGRDQVAAGDRDGIAWILRAYGGMGSINDLPLGYDHPVMRIGSEVWQLATAIQKARER